jgi:integrase
MGFPNVALRGSTYYWRKKITVAGVCVPVALPLDTGRFKQACVIALRLGSVVEALRMAYGQSSGMAPDKLRQIFSDAMRWQLQRILDDQSGSRAPPVDHAAINSIYAEAWGFLARHGVEAKWSLDEHDRLIVGGWHPDDAKAVGDAVFDSQATHPVSGVQLETYAETLGINTSKDNLDRMTRTVCAARAAACRKATGHLTSADDLTAEWIRAALADEAPFAFEEIDEQSHVSRSAFPTESADQATCEPAPRQETNSTPIPIKVKKWLLDAANECIVLHQQQPHGSLSPFPDAANECIVLHQQQKAWNVISIGQVRTALALFDHACGGEIYIEDLHQHHVTAFTELCRALPNRWGRTTEEKAGGIAASLARAKNLSADEVGLGQATINKHLTWIAAVLAFAAGDSEDSGHRPAQVLSFKNARAGIGKKARQQHQRKRDKRANWTKQEVARLLSAPIWTGAAGIDQRLHPGSEIIHDAWYWLPLMLALYGGRSSELAGLALAEIHEQDDIPYFLIDFTEDRGLKTAQSIRKLPIHPELIRLGFNDYVAAIRTAGCKMLFPEMDSPESKSFASTFYKTIFEKWRLWAFPQGTEWRHKVGGAWIDKDVHSFRGTATSMLKGKVQDSVRCDIFGHEGETETSRTYDEEADLAIKLDALRHLTPLTQHIKPSLPIRIRTMARLRHGVRNPSQPSRLGVASSSSTDG